MAAFSIKHFDRQTRKLKITDQQLCQALRRVRSSQADAALGGGLFKQRVPRSGEGRSRGFRVVFCLTNDNNAIFLTAFAKKQQANITDRDWKSIRKTAAMYRGLKPEDLAAVQRSGSLREIECEPEGGDHDAKD